MSSLLHFTMKTLKIQRGKQNGERKREKWTETGREDQHLAISPSNLSLWTRIKTEDQVQNQVWSYQIFKKLSSQMYVQSKWAHYGSRVNKRSMIGKAARSYTGREAWGSAHTERPRYVRVAMRNTHTVHMQSVLSERDEWIKAPLLCWGSVLPGSGSLSVSKLNEGIRLWVTGVKWAQIYASLLQEVP